MDSSLRPISNIAGVRRNKSAEIVRFFGTSLHFFGWTSTILSGMTLTLILSRILDPTPDDIVLIVLWYVLLLSVAAQFTLLLLVVRRRSWHIISFLVSIIVVLSSGWLMDTVDNGYFGLHQERFDKAVQWALTENWAREDAMIHLPAEFESLGVIGVRHQGYCLYFVVGISAMGSERGYIYDLSQVPGALNNDALGSEYERLSSRWYRYSIY